MPLSFSYHKTTQSLNFFARKNSGAINKLKALKLLYFADRYHLRKYGRPITNDEYFAMNYGPVPSGAKDLAEGSDFLAQAEKDYAGQFICATSERYEFSSLANIEEDIFSESDREALEFSWNTFSRFDEFKLAELTHEYPEWKKHEAALKDGLSSRVKMNYSDFLEDSDTAVNPCYSLTNEERNIRREEIEELAEIHALWN